MTHTPHDDFTLAPADAAALDGLLESGGARGEAAAGPRTDGLAGVLALLATVRGDDVGEGDGERLVAETLTRVGAAERGFTLDEADAARLDALLEHGGSCDVAAARSGSAVVAGLDGVVGLLDTMRVNDRAAVDVDADESLVRRTVATAMDQRQRERFASQVALVADVPVPRGLSASWRQVTAAAAVFVVGFSLMMPAINRTRDAAQVAGCENNLATAGMQLGAYAADHKGTLPRGPVGDSWIKTGQPDAVTADGRFQSNSAHLYLLIREDYLAPEYLACGGNKAATTTPTVAGQMDWAAPQAVSYSYQNQYGPRPIRLDLARPGLAVLADKNPRFVAQNGKLVFDTGSSENAMSRQHRSAGQNILTLDGAARWSDSPVARGDDDNVWTKAGFEGTYVGNEVPTNGNQDSFLVP